LRSATAALTPDSRFSSGFFEVPWGPWALVRTRALEYTHGNSFALVRHKEETEGRSMGILSWIVFGLVVGIIAKLLMPGRDPGGFIVTILLGIAGALVGGFIGRAMGFYGEGQTAGYLVSILGAIILLALYRMMVRRRV
jgi:uncharacterized membrane protein YeaQ/YmgE (transglycosylase-associated protein family)